MLNFNKTYYLSLPIVTNYCLQLPICVIVIASCSMRVSLSVYVFRSICRSTCVSVCLYVRLSVGISVCMSVCQIYELSVCISAVCRIIYLFVYKSCSSCCVSEYCSLAQWGRSHKNGVLDVRGLH